MSTTTSARPIGVTIVAVLLLISGVLGLIGGIFGFVGAANMGSASVEGVVLDPLGLNLLSGFFLLAAVLNIVFAFGILRGSRIARLIVTILQVLSIISGVASLVMGGVGVWSGILNLVLPILIIVLLWVGEQTKAFFAR
jgi:hypothetical protein